MIGVLCARQHTQWMSKATQSSRQLLASRPLAQRLESRILFSADPVAAAFEPPPALVTTLVEQPQLATPIELIVIDTRVEGYQQMVADIVAQQQTGQPLQLLLIGAQDDAISAINSAINDAKQPFSAIHIVSHGSAGELELGRDGLNQQVISQRASDIAQWGSNLTDQADIRIYGCDFAANQAGKDTLTALASLTGADLAASVDLTGAALRGANWELEQQVGLIQSDSAFSHQLQRDWRSVLYGAVTNVTSETDTTPEQTQQVLDSNRSLATNSNGVSALVLRDELGEPRIHFYDANETVINANNAITRPLSALPAEQAVLRTSYINVTALKDNNFMVAWVAEYNDGTSSVNYRTYNALGQELATQGETSRVDLIIRDISVSGLSIDKFAISYGTQSTTATSRLNSRFNLILSQPTVGAQLYSFAETGAEYTAADVAFVDATHLLVAITTVDTASGTNANNVRVFEITTTALSAGLQLNNASLPTTLVFTNSTIIDSNIDNPSGTVTSGKLNNPSLTKVGHGQWAVGFTEDQTYANGAVETNAFLRLVDARGTTQSDFKLLNAGLDLNKTNNLRVAYDAQRDQIISVFSAEASDRFIHQIVLHDRYLNEIDRSRFTSGLSESFKFSGLTINDGEFLLAQHAHRGTTPTRSVDLVKVDTGIGTVVISKPPVGYQESSYPISFSLSEQPQSDVALTLTQLDGTLLGTVLTFTQENWNQPQTISFSLNTPFLGSELGDHQISGNIGSTDGTFPFQSLTIDYQVVEAPSRLVVTTHEDGIDGNVGSISSLLYNQGQDQKISLREALAAINNTPAGSVIPEITFDFSNGENRILLTQELPWITKPVIIGTLNADLSRPVVIIDGQGLVGSGLVLATGSQVSVIRGIAIGNFKADPATGFGGNGIAVYSEDTRIENNWLGIDIDRPELNTMALEGFGVYLSAANHARITDNQINHAFVGIQLANTHETEIVGNKIGEIKDNNNVGIVNDGIKLIEGSYGNKITDNVVVNCGYGERISPSGQIYLTGGSGIRLGGAGTNGNFLFRNHIGILSIADIGGNNGCANEGISIEDAASYNQIGSENSSDKNWIANSTYAGIRVYATDLARVPVHNTILINFITFSASPANGYVNRAIELSVSPDTPASYQTGWNNTAQQDGLDADEGPNGLINSLDAADSAVAINPDARAWTAFATDREQLFEGIYSGSPNKTFRIDFYVGAISEDPQLDIHVGSTEVTTDASGKARFATRFYAAIGNPINLQATAVVTEILSQDAVTSQNYYGSSSRASLPVALDGSLPTLSAPPPIELEENRSRTFILNLTEYTGDPTAISVFLVGDPQFSYQQFGDILKVTFSGADFENPNPVANASHTYTAAIRFTDSLGRSSETRTLTATVTNVDEAATLRIEKPNQDIGVSEGVSIQLGEANPTGSGQGRRIIIDEPDNVGTFRYLTLTLVAERAWIQSNTSLPSGPPAPQVEYDDQNRIIKLSVSADVGALQTFLDQLYLVPTSFKAEAASLIVTLDSSNLGPAARSTATLEVPVGQTISRPLLNVKIPDLVVEESTTVLTRDMFSISVDQALDPDNSVFILVKDPDFGKLWVRDQRLSAGDTFTAAQLIAGEITYINTRLTPSLESMEFILVDSTGAGSEAATSKILITPDPANLPTLDLVSNIVAAENTTQSWLFRFGANESGGPARLSLSGSDAARFTVQVNSLGVAQLNWIYSADFDQPNSAAGNNDYQVTIKIEDSFGRILNRPVAVTVTDVNESGAVIVNGLFTGTEDLPVNLIQNNSSILITDPDRNASVQELTLSITNGVLLLPSALESISSNKVADTLGLNQVTFSGLPEQLNQALAQLQVQSYVNGSGTINLRLSLSDSSSLAGAVQTTLNILISPQNDLPQITLTAASLNEGAQFKIGIDQIAGDDIETAIRELHYELASLPLIGELRLNGAALAVGQRFTQAQLEAGELSYQHQSANTGTETLMLAVIDGDGGKSAASALKLQVRPIASPVSITPPSSTPTPAPVAQPPAVTAPSETPDESATATPASRGAINSAPAKVIGATSNGGTTNQNVASDRSQPVASADLSHSRQVNYVSPTVSTPSRAINLSANHLGSQASGTDSSSQFRSGIRSTEAIQALANVKTQMTSASFSNGMTQLRDDLSKEISLERTVVSSTVAVSTGVSIGYVIWMLRGGILLSSLMASLPAWRTFDPLPILSSGVGPAKKGEDDSLENLLDKAKEKLEKIARTKALEEQQAS